MTAAAATADDTAPAKPKSKKLLFIIVGVLVLALVGAGAAFFLLKKKHAEDEGDSTDAHQKASAHEVAKRDPKVPPTFLPLDSMVVNLADPGGNRFAQLGITLQLPDAHVADEIKTYMPTIRNGILILVSQRTAEQLLGAEGKQALTEDIVAEISNVMGYEYEPPEADDGSKSKKKHAVYNPIEGVLFSSFIVQ